MIKRTFAWKDKAIMTLDYKAGKVFYEVTGSGTTCVLLHGFLENHKLWEPLKNVLKENYKIVVIDLPGHGSSEVLRGTATMDAMAEVVWNVLKTLNLNKVHILGHSMGGYVGLAFANAYPSYIEGLLLLNSTPKADSVERVKSREHGIAVAAKNYKAIVKMSIANLFTRENRSILKNEIEFLKKEALKTPLEGYIVAQRAMMIRPDFTSFFKEASFKKMMILGENDPIIEAFAVKNELINSVEDIIIIAGGHQLILENFKTTRDLILEFLEKPTIDAKKNLL